MAQPTGVVSTYDLASGNREDLADVIKDVSPTDTPLFTMAGMNEATATNHEWLTDALTAAAQNANVEGDDANPTAPAARTRLGNQTQILKKHAVVTGTQEKVDKAGVKSEMSYQLARRLKEIKRDLEHSLLNPYAKVVGNDTTARVMGSLHSYLVTNNQLAGGSSDPTGDGTDLSDGLGGDRALSETILQAGLQSLYTNSGGNESVNMVVSASHKTLVSGFSSAATRYVTTDDKKLVASIDVYVGDFHTVRVIPDRYIDANHAFVIDPEYIKCSQLRSVHSYDLAKTGDSHRKEVIWELTLEVCDEKAHVMIGDLTA